MKLPKTKDRLTLVTPIESCHWSTIVLVRCECGKEKSMLARRYKHSAKSCGCLHSESVSRNAEISGPKRSKVKKDQEFGQLTVYEYIDRFHVICMCANGHAVIVVSDNLLLMRTLYCRQCHPLTKTGTSEQRIDISQDDFDYAFKKQDGTCLICKCKESARNRTLSKDHDHRTGLFRALLCSRCNVALGFFRDSSQVLRSAALYLQIWSPIVKKEDFNRAQFLRQFKEQVGFCKICSRIPDKKLSVDHCHRTGFVRGLLCNDCNCGLGLAGDNPALLELMARYVEGDVS